MPKAYSLSLIQWLTGTLQTMLENDCITHPAYRSHFSIPSKCTALNSANACGAPDDLIEPHAIYRLLGTSPESRHAPYRQLFRSSISEDEMCRMRDATQHALPLGSAAFLTKIAASCRAGLLSMGRPRKEQRESLESRV